MRPLSLTVVLLLSSASVVGAQEGQEGGIWIVVPDGVDLTAYEQQVGNAFLMSNNFLREEIAQLGSNLQEVLRDLLPVVYVDEFEVDQIELSVVFTAGGRLGILFFGGANVDSQAGLKLVLRRRR